MKVHLYHAALGQGERSGTPRRASMEQVLPSQSLPKTYGGEIIPCCGLSLLALLIATSAFAETLSPEADACQASGRLALKQKYPQVKDVMIDVGSARIIKANTTIENVPIKTVVIGDAYIERTKTTKPQTLVCVIGDKGKVLLTLFSDK